MRRTWTRQAPGAWRPLGVHRLSCGCWWDGYGDRMWEPCMAHEGEGHLSVISESDGLAVVRCLVCRFTETWAQQSRAAGRAQEHWSDTRA